MNYTFILSLVCFSVALYSYGDCALFEHIDKDWIKFNERYCKATPTPAEVMKYEKCEHIIAKAVIEQYKKCAKEYVKGKKEGMVLPCYLLDNNDGAAKAEQCFQDDVKAHRDKYPTNEEVLKQAALFKKCIKDLEA